jgi:hypothetical protein
MAVIQVDKVMQNDPSSARCNDPVEPAEVMPLMRMPQRVFSYPTPGGAAGCCTTAFHTTPPLYVLEKPNLF